MGGHDLGELKVLTATLPNADAAKLRQMGDMLRDKQPNVGAVLSAVNDGKITFLAVCGSRAAVCSSSRRSLGFCSVAMRRVRACLWPPESSPTLLLMRF